MPESLNPSYYPAFFFFGVIVQVLLLRKNTGLFSWLGFFALSAFAFFALAALKFFEISGVLPVFGIFVLYFVLSCAALFGSGLLPSVSRRTAAAITVIFWYLLSTGFRENPGWPAYWLYVLAVPSMALLVLAANNWPLARLWKRLAYVWFLIMLMGIFLSQFIYSGFVSQLAGGSLAGFKPFELLFLGMSSAFLALMLWTLLLLLPFQFFHPSLDTGEAIRIWEKQGRIAAVKYLNDEGQGRLDVFWVVAVFGFLLYLNFLYKPVASATAASIMLVWAFYYSPPQKP